MMMINISFYTLVLMILVSILTVTHEAEPDNPCPNEHEAIVADMCTDDSAVEDSSNGGKAVDSVLLRIKKQQSNCICHVSLQNTVSNYTVYMSKYEEQSNAAPEYQNCGLAVDVAYLDTSGTTRSLQPINCTKGTSKRPIALGGNELQLRSRTIAGDFTTGYCIQILRNTCNMASQKNKSGIDDWYEAIRKTSTQECEEYCLKTEACVAVSYGETYCYVYNQTTEIILKDNSTYSQKICSDIHRLLIRCYHPESSTQTSHVTATEDNHSTQKETVTSPTSDHPVTNSNTKSTMQLEKEDENFDLYVYIGAAAGGVLMLLLIVFIIVCIRKKSNQTSLKESKNDPSKQICSETRDSDSDYWGLKDNILYVSSEPNEILEDGNYNTVDLEQTRKVNQDNHFDGNYSTVDGTCSIIGSYSDSSLSKTKPVIKPKPKTSFKSGSVEETIHLSTMDNSNNEYAVVDKGRNSDAVKHTNPVHGNDTEYAVVNKVKRSSNNN